MSDSRPPTRGEGGRGGGGSLGYLITFHSHESCDRILVWSPLHYYGVRHNTVGKLGMQR